MGHFIGLPSNLLERRNLALNAQVHLTEAVVEETTKSLLVLTAENTKKNNDQGKHQASATQDAFKNKNNTGQITGKP